MARLHPDELDIDVALVRRLLRAQHPALADDPIAAVPSSGTVHRLFRIGDQLVARLPRRPSDGLEIEKERTWLPVLAPHLPAAIPEPVAAGEPTEEYPLPWAVYRWLEGAHPDPGALRDPDGLARDLADVVRSLQQVPTDGAPRAFRQERLHARDEPTRASIDAAADEIDAAAAHATWAEAMAQPDRPERHPWQHGDLLPGNLLVDPASGRLTAILDWGCAGTGDPAVELLPAWAVLPAPARRTFRDLLSVDEATWQRGRAWALSVAALQVPYYRVTNPVLAAIGRRVLAEIATDRS